MTYDLTLPSEVFWHTDEEEPPDDWSGAVAFPTLREALEAIFTGTPQTGHPWARSGTRVFAPREIETLWSEDGMPEA